MTGFDRRTLFIRGAAVAGTVLLSGGATQVLAARGVAAAPGRRVQAPDNGGYGPLGPVRDMTTGLLVPLLYNTQGGPRRDSCARVLGIDHRPVPGLYAAGEFGSIWGCRYQTSTNFAEALAFGRIAGCTAAAG